MGGMGDCARTRAESSQLGCGMFLLLPSKLIASPGDLDVWSATNLKRAQAGDNVSLQQRSEMPCSAARRKIAEHKPLGLARLAA